MSKAETLKMSVALRMVKDMETDMTLKRLVLKMSEFRSIPSTLRLCDYLNDQPICLYTQPYLWSAVVSLRLMVGSDTVQRL